MNRIRIDPEILSGTPCFAGTRVPIKNLFDLFEHGRTIDYFLKAFPSVTRDQVLAVLELACEKLLLSAASAA